MFSPVAKSRCWGRPTQALGFALARYTPTGKLDTTFGSNGTLITSFAGDFVTANALAIQLGGKIVAVGSYATDGQNNFDYGYKLARYLGAIVRVLSRCLSRSYVFRDLTLYSSDLPRGMLSIFHSLERRCLARKTICPVCCA